MVKIAGKSKNALEPNTEFITKLKTQIKDTKNKEKELYKDLQSQQGEIHFLYFRIPLTWYN